MIRVDRQQCMRALNVRWSPPVSLGTSTPPSPTHVGSRHPTVALPSAPKPPSKSRTFLLGRGPGIIHGTRRTDRFFTNSYRRVLCLKCSTYACAYNVYEPAHSAPQRLLEAGERPAQETRATEMGMPESTSPPRPVRCPLYRVHSYTSLVFWSLGHCMYVNNL